MRLNVSLLNVLAFIIVANLLSSGNQVVGDDRTNSYSTSSAFTVMTYNIHHGRGVDDQVNLQRIAEVIKESAPDLVALQEVDDKTMRTSLVDQTAELARLVGMEGLFVRQIDYEGGRYGQAILCRFPAKDLFVHWLPGAPERERRIAGAVNVRLGSREIVFVTTHLHHANDTIRALQAHELNRVFTSNDMKDRIVIVAGDLNAVPKSDTLGILEKHWQSVTAERTDALTFPANVPNRQLDYILYRPTEALRVVESWVIGETLASDHRPLVAKFAFLD